MKWILDLIQRRRMRRDVAEEVEAHIAERAAELTESGLSELEAQQQSRREFGNATLLTEISREAWGWTALERFGRDLRFGLRLMGRSPGFTTVAVLSLALGIGANTAIFSLAETLLMQSLAVEDPEGLRILAWTSGPKTLMDSISGTCYGVGSQYCYSFSYPVFEELRKEAPGFSSVFAFKAVGATALVEGRAEMVVLNLVSGDYFSALGVQPALGRGIFVEDERQKNLVTVIGDSFWTRRFGRDAGIIGKHIAVSDRVLTIVGVSPPQFRGMHEGENPDLFLPITLQGEIAPRQGESASMLRDADLWWVEVAGRLKPDVAESTARAGLDVVLQRTVKAQLTKTDRDELSLRLEPGGKGYDELRRKHSKSLVVLMSVVALVLLIACANLASLLLARAAVRQREMGIRLALGAGRWPLVCQGLTESLAIALIGGALGLVLAVWTKNAMPSLLGPSWFPSSLTAHFDNRVLAFALGTTLLTSLIFGLAPALRATRVDVNASLKVSSRSQTQNRSSQFATKAIVVFQISLSVLLLMGAGLFLRTLVNLRSVQIGFNPQSIILFTIDPPRNRYTGAKRVGFFQRLEAQIAQIPGVESSTLLSVDLISGSTSTTTIPSLDRPHDPVQVWLNWTGDNFFQTMQLPILQGRPFGIHDRRDSPKVVVINEALAKALFPKGNPIGQTLGSGKNNRGEVIGVCLDAKYRDLRQAPPPTAYFPYSQDSDAGSMTVAVRSHAGPTSILAAARKVVDGLDKDVPILNVRTQTEQIDASLKTERLFAAVTAGFGLLAVVLASIGIYGVMAYTVSRRTSEIGIRMALGAMTTEVSRMILREALILAVAGIGIGLAGALGATRLVANMLYGLKPEDPITIVGTFLVITAVALLAGWIPARRASRVDPMSALRQE